GPSTNVLTTVVTEAGVPPKSDTNRLTVIVTEQNSAPVLPLQPNQFLSGTQSLVVVNAATDADLPVNTLTYQLLNPPSGATIDPNGVISWTPIVAQVPGTYVLTTLVTDDNPWAANARQLSATNSFTVVVYRIHDGPVLPVQATRTLDELTPLVVTNTAADHDIPPPVLSYMLMSPPAGASIDTNGIITWTPAEGQGPSTNVFTTFVVDNDVSMKSDVKSFTVIVNEVNRAPQLPVQTDRTLAGFQRLLVTNTAADVDLPANPLTYTLLSAPTNAAISTNGVITWMPTAEQLPSTYVFTTKVTDFSPQAVNVQALSTTNSFTVVAIPITNGPALPAQPDLAINELTSLAVTNTATDNDQPYRTVSYTLVDPPSGAAIDTNGVIKWTPTEAQGPSTNHFITIASDDGLPVKCATNRFTVIVKEVNTAPVLPAQVDRTLAGLETLRVTNTATDADLPGNRLTYRLATGPANATIDAKGLITWTPTEAQGVGSYLFTTVVIDDNPEAINASSLSATNSFTVVVTNVHVGPRPPVQADRIISESTALVVTNTAVDTDLPVLHLSYTLLKAPT
ncbi:MAG TPA: hypothetical protein VNT26_12280, partial [Candidatus Sulfotelmatobacter sp.]|nr:hypothetical protein [Candidatus Sulfotelmatobacter sp.]